VRVRESDLSPWDGHCATIRSAAATAKTEDIARPSHGRGEIGKSVSSWSAGRADIC
jgi:hypothetical protein